MYKLYVRPHLEYCIEVWNPKSRVDIGKMEKVQNRMTKLARNTHGLRPEQRNAVLGLSSHEERRLRGDMINMYKNINDEALFTLRNDDRTRRHSKMVRVPRSHCMIKDHSFSARAVHNWNSLPSRIVESTNLNIFKSNIDRHMLLGHANSL